jgi:hypothetical protein
MPLQDGAEGRDTITCRKTQFVANLNLCQSTRGNFGLVYPAAFTVKERVKGEPKLVVESGIGSTVFGTEGVVSHTENDKAVGVRGVFREDSELGVIFSQGFAGG